MAENLTFNQALNLYKIRYRVMYHNYLESLENPHAFVTLENMYGRLMEMRYVLMEMYHVTESDLDGLADDAKNDRPVIITRGDHIRTMTDEELAESTLENLIDIWKYGSCSYHVWQMLTWSGVMDPLLASLDFKKGPDGCYHVDTEGFPIDIAGKHFGCWQEAGGYTDAYDVVFDAFCDMERDTFEFEVDGKPYTLWFWKGEYMNLGAGGESGIYRGNKMTDDFCTVDTEMEIPMKMTIDYGNGTRRTWNNNGKETWWNTSFDPRQQNIKAEDIKITYEMDFSDKPEAWDGVRRSARNKRNEGYYFDERSKKLYYTM